VSARPNRSIALAAAVTLAAALGGACSNGGAAAGPIRLRVQTTDATFQSTLPATLALALGTTVSAFQLGITAGGDRGIWTGVALLTRDQVLAGAATLNVTAAPDGIANVQVSGSPTLVASAGTLDVTFGHGSLSGMVTDATPAPIDSVFSGDLDVECWVPPSAFTDAGAPAAPEDGGAPGDDGGAGSGSETLQLDATFSTPACMPFRMLAP
jgi:hypothetical protein